MLELTYGMRLDREGKAALSYLRRHGRLVSDIRDINGEPPPISAVARDV